MSKENNKVKIAVFPKVVQLIVALGCFVALFLPWCFDSTIVEYMPYSMGWFVPLVAVGAIVLIMSIIVLATKSNGVNIASNILGILGSLPLVFEVLLQVVFTSGFGFDSSEYQIAVWMQLVLGIILFVFSIISLATTKKVKE